MNNSIHHQRQSVPILSGELLAFVLAVFLIACGGCASRPVFVKITTEPTGARLSAVVGHRNPPVLQLLGTSPWSAGWELRREPDGFITFKAELEGYEGERFVYQANLGEPIHIKLYRTGPTVAELRDADYGQMPDITKMIDSIKSRLEKSLIDPTSYLTRFGQVNKVFWINGDAIVFGWNMDFEVNAKNSFGGYTGWKSGYIRIKDNAIASFKVGNEDF